MFKQDEACYRNRERVNEHDDKLVTAVVVGSEAEVEGTTTMLMMLMVRRSVAISNFVEIHLILAVFLSNKHQRHPRAKTGDNAMTNQLGQHARR